MRRSQLFGETLRQAPAEIEIAGHQLLVRGGYIQPLATGIYSFLPLGQLVKGKVEAMLREEMEGIGAQEVTLPVVQPAEIWQESGRWQSIGSELARFTDRAGRSLVLAMTHEEVVADLLRKTIQSYRQLPQVLYQIQTKFRDEPRSRGGLLRAREFTMKDAYSAHASLEDLDRYYPRVCEAYLRIFRRCGLEVLPVQADTGMMGGSGADEFMYLTPIGEDVLALCPACNYAANRQVATFRKDAPEAEEPLPIERVATPETKTIADLAALLAIPAARTAKATFFVATVQSDPAERAPRRQGRAQNTADGLSIEGVQAPRGTADPAGLAEYGAGETPALPEELALEGTKRGSGAARYGAGETPALPEEGMRTSASPVRDRVGERLIFAVVRGDMEVNETKLANAVGASELRPAQAEDLAGTDIVPGYASPIGIRGATVVVDDLVLRSPNLVAGANLEGYHLRHTNAGRDYTADIVADIARAYEGAPCPRCGAPLRLERGVEVGNTFKLGTKYSRALGAQYLDEAGQLRDIVMGSYGIGVGRLIACVAEAHHDERGLIWPAALAPFAVYLVGLDPMDAAVRAATEALYEELRAERIAVLYDDRDERAGVKFNDADLLGMPLRVTVSRRTLRVNAVEMKGRTDSEGRQAPLAEAVGQIRDALADSGTPRANGPG
jgi:prolyl-tRNA synthetase